MDGFTACRPEGHPSGRTPGAIKPTSYRSGRAQPARGRSSGHTSPREPRIQRGNKSCVNAIVAVALPLRASILNCTLAGGFADTTAM
ncbi:hypothetical protein Lysil_1626 [Lysobacter silvestris]|uniref:Uncharacterized protein n=1 Tax=Solilutibacter silvestris TaxID=1645665 RepID=A0A2K1PXD6_9GAMM|nr:hypothetical protein Lysil_1626 [Lysobacter silvestris]